MNSNGNETIREKPLNHGARVLLVASVGLAMLSFYAYSLLAVLFLAGLILCELGLLVALARFGASRLMVPFLQKHLDVLRLFVKSFRLHKGVEFQLLLARADAPALHDRLASLCRRLEMDFPREVALQMGDGASVRLHGFRRGSGQVTLHVGYDLLAGLTADEMEAVLAHEMSHAKLMNRGYRNWLWGAQSRVRNLAQALWTVISTARGSRKSARVAEALFTVVDRLLRLCTRLIATYSRQDEFEADRGAAELCGSAVMKSALSKLESLHYATSRLPWNERVAQLQQPGGYSQWLLHEIAQGAPPPPATEANDALFNQYSTHPSIPDRLLALPADDRVPDPQSPPAIRLLAHPDNVARRLLTELQRLMAEQEKQDSRALEKFSRRTGRDAHLRPWQNFGFLLIVAGIVCCLAGLSAPAPTGVVLPGAVAIIAGVAALRLGGYRDRMELPIPNYEILITPSSGKPSDGNLAEKEKSLQAALRERFAHEHAGKAAKRLAEESYAALQTCDYLRAHVAARECLRFDKKSTEAALALAVASAAFGNVPSTLHLLAFVQKQTGLKTFASAWGAAWAAMLAGDWIRAEAMLEKALKMRPAEFTLVSLLAIAQSRRGKLQSSIVNARLACDACPASTARQKFLIARLLDGGFTQEARERMQRLGGELQTDPELMLARTQYELLQRHFGEADQWMARLKQAGCAGQMLVRLARLYETARSADQAAGLYGEALAIGHYPEAHLGLGRIEAGRNHKEEARGHLRAALNVDRPVGQDGVTTWQILGPIFTQMLCLQEPVPNCRAWIVAFPANGHPAPLANQSFTIYAADLREAQDYFLAILGAFQPEKPPEILPPGNWRPAPRPLQPVGPVRPGVQGLWQ